MAKKPDLDYDADPDNSENVATSEITFRNVTTSSKNKNIFMCNFQISKGDLRYQHEDGECISLHYEKNFKFSVPFSYENETQSYSYGLPMILLSKSLCRWFPAVSKISLPSGHHERTKENITKQARSFLRSVHLQLICWRIPRFDEMCLLYRDLSAGDFRPGLRASIENGESIRNYNFLLWPYDPEEQECDDAYRSLTMSYPELPIAALLSEGDYDNNWRIQCTRIPGRNILEIDKNIINLSVHCMKRNLEAHPSQHVSPSTLSQRRFLSAAIAALLPEGAYDNVRELRRLLYEFDTYKNVPRVLKPKIDRLNRQLAESIGLDDKSFFVRQWIRQKQTQIKFSCRNQSAFRYVMAHKLKYKRLAKSRKRLGSLIIAIAVCNGRGFTPVDQQAAINVVIEQGSQRFKKKLPKPTKLFSLSKELRQYISTFYSFSMDADAMPFCSLGMASQNHYEPFWVDLSDNTTGRIIHTPTKEKNYFILEIDIKNGFEDEYENEFSRNSVIIEDQHVPLVSERMLLQTDDNSKTQFVSYYETLVLGPGERIWDTKAKGKCQSGEYNGRQHVHVIRLLGSYEPIPGGKRWQIQCQINKDGYLEIDPLIINLAVKRYMEIGESFSDSVSDSARRCEVNKILEGLLPARIEREDGNPMKTGNSCITVIKKMQSWRQKDDLEQYSKCLEDLARTCGVDPDFLIAQRNFKFRLAKLILVCCLGEAKLILLRSQNRKNKKDSNTKFGPDSNITKDSNIKS
eukprot:gene700-606_t